MNGYPSAMKVMALRSRILTPIVVFASCTFVGAGNTAAGSVRIGVTLVPVVQAGRTNPAEMSTITLGNQAILNLPRESKLGDSITIREMPSPTDSSRRMYKGAKGEQDFVIITHTYTAQ